MVVRTLILIWLVYYVMDVTRAVDTLYADSDPIVQLDVTDFSRRITGTSHGWIVEFYASWCGHCQRFAPVYREFAEDIAGWSGVIKVAAMACSDPKNLPICQMQNIRGFPTVKFFPPNMTSVARGFQLSSLRFNADSLRDATITFVKDYVLRSNLNLPSLDMYRSLEELKIAARNSGAENLFAIIQSGRAGEDDLAQLVILDMSASFPRAVIGRLPASAIQDRDSLWQPLPIVVSISLPDGPVRFITQLNNREDVKRVLTTLTREAWRLDATTPALTLHVSRPAASHGHQPADVRPTAQELPLMVSLQTTTPVMLDEDDSSDAHAPDGQVQYSPARPLTENDLDSNIYYMLWNEVATRRRIRGSALNALTEYLSVLKKYHPSDDRLHSFIDAVFSWMDRVRGSLDSTLYVNTIDGLQTDEAYVEKELNWEACLGSESQFRGYPCSLWMTFHALTVQAYEYHLQNPQETFSPMEVLGAIRGYVRHYLGCRECADHFLRMARHMEQEAKEPEDVILWLWWGHNRVNNRLHGDPTEDPEHPKIQFPGPIACPSCRLGHAPFDKFNNDTYWNIPEVMKYLRKFYSKERILGYYPSTVLPPAIISSFPTLATTLDADAKTRELYQPGWQPDRNSSFGSLPKTDHSRSQQLSGNRQRQDTTIPSRDQHTQSSLNDHGQLQARNLDSSASRLQSGLPGKPEVRRSDGYRRAIDGTDSAVLSDARQQRQPEELDSITGKRQGSGSRTSSSVSDNRRQPYIIRTNSSDAGGHGNQSCVVNSTSWSSCTVTCDVGISTRLSNDNKDCVMRMERRVCQLRPCSYNIGNPRPDATSCIPNMRSATPASLIFDGCTSHNAYAWRFCNQCPGHCCEPANESTFWLDVTCRHGDEVQTGYMPISWIIGCHCRFGSC